MKTDLDDKQAGGEALPQLRYLRLLVTGLAVIMGAGMIAIVALLWMRLSVPPLPELPVHLALPGGVRPQALTFAPDWIVVVDQAGAVWLFDRQSGDLVSQTPRP